MTTKRQPLPVVEVFHPHKLKTVSAMRERKQQAMAERLGQVRIVDRVASSKHPQQTRDAILQSLERWPGAVLRVIGGDGSLNTAAHALMLQDPAQRSALSPSRTGSAKDFYYNHNSVLAGLGPLHLQLCRSLRRPPDMVYPLRMHVHNPGGQTDTHYANNTFGFNYTGRFAQLLDAPAYRESPLKAIPLAGDFALDALTVVRSLRGLDTFRSNDSRHGQLELNDRSLVHAQKVAKHTHFRSDSHTQPGHFFDSKTAAPTARAVLWTLGSMALGLAGGEHTRCVDFENGDKDIFGHKDGEYFTIPAGAFVEVTIAPDPIQVYGTRSARTVPDLLPPVA